MNNLSKDAFLVNEIIIKTDPSKLSQNDRRRLKEITTQFSETKSLSVWELSELRRLRALSNRSDTRWLHQDVQARFNAVYNPARPR
jgi:hypothetical protein